MNPKTSVILVGSIVGSFFGSLAVLSLEIILIQLIYLTEKNPLFGVFTQRTPIEKSVENSNEDSETENSNEDSETDIVDYKLNFLFEPIIALFICNIILSTVATYLTIGNAETSKNLKSENIVIAATIYSTIFPIVVFLLSIRSSSYIGMKDPMIDQRAVKFSGISSEDIIEFVILTDKKYPINKDNFQKIRIEPKNKSENEWEFIYEFSKDGTREIIILGFDKFSRKVADEYCKLNIQDSRSQPDKVGDQSDWKVEKCQ